VPADRAVLVRIPTEAGDVSLLQNVLTAAGIEPASCGADACVLSPDAKLVAFKFDHSPPSDAEIKNDWRCTSTPQHACIAFTLTMYLECLHSVSVLCAAVLTGRHLSHHRLNSAQFRSPDAAQSVLLRTAQL
jgi:hypothetical protein